MAVELLHAKGGYALDPDVDSGRQIDKLVLSNLNNFAPLKEGNYDLTRISAINDSGYRHWLIVLENGTGIRRAIPRTIPDLSRGDRIVGLRGRTVEISQPDQVIVISTYLPNTGQTKVYDIIRYVPGCSPR
jgi:hypothetical protein